MTALDAEDWVEDLKSSKAHIEELDAQIKEAKWQHDLKILKYEKEHLQTEIADVLDTKQGVISVRIKRTREALAKGEHAS
ncbi:hypothetical protein [Brevibacterium renqingii]|uniref:hypothetical protein n=1 Tax=Brevibacterium renqingii TaxID=2776916 RepID=UPI001ADFB7ED|nr:hypothetical protein [Brevibacterium renqingii]